MNKMDITAITALFVFTCSINAMDWTEEEWKKEKGSFGWVFPHIDKNADGKVTAAEYEAFQKYKKKNPNWESELNPNAKPEASKNNEDIPQGIEALEAALNEERMAQAVEMFEKLDKNKDGKITVPEVPAKQFEKKVWKIGRAHV